ncbi:hypothetical protein INT45_001538 [Circinella minor]|uniref:3'-5' exonuclease domain-containing protein n=1 Tax=Circinella minor TaxID=1195481 RepID=A0A8H7RWL6_9FUNG|nr:hypothetical protein INT45_001538 [Circinella minor]
MRHDTLELQYFDAVNNRQKQQKRQMSIIAALNSRIVYPEVPKLITNLMMMLGGEIFKGGHSFKIIKNMGAIIGEPTFTAMYTVVNEFGEIRLFQLVPTKSLNHLAPQFDAMMKPYNYYGHSEVKVFFMDNVKGDKHFLESRITSLRNNVKDVEQATTINNDSNTINTNLPTMTIPESTTHFYIKDATIINRHCDSLIRKLMDEIIVIGLDTEWNYNKTTKIKGKVSIIQLAYEDIVYVFHLNNNNSTLPMSLAALLRSDRILKTGKMVNDDLSKITRNFISSFTRNREEQEYCWGGLELGSFCCDRGAISDEEAIHLSNWNTTTLSTSQIKYAALDALVSLKIYNTVHSRPLINQPITKATPHGTFVSLHPVSSRRPAAYGVISEEQPQSYNNTVINDSKILISIINVTIPAALIDSCNTLKPLETFGNVTFLAVIDITQLKTSTKPIATVAVNQHIKINQEQRHEGSPSSLSNSLINNNSANIVNNIEEYNEISVEVDEEEEQEDDTESNSTDNNENSVLEIDEESMKFGCEQMDQALQRSTSDADTNDGQVHSRVLKDLFHLIDSIKVSLKHGLSKERTWKQEMERNLNWLLKRIKRVVPSPQELIPIVRKLFEDYGPLKCSKTGHTLFTRANWKQATNIFEAIRLGHVSDPLGLSLYLYIATDKNNLPIYKCFRGTNSVEGGIHQNVIHNLTSFNAGPQLTDVGTLNRYVEYLEIDKFDISNSQQETSSMTNVRFATAKEPDWDLMAKLWSVEARETIYYKTPEQLKMYEDIRNNKSTYINTVNIDYTICKNMRKIVLQSSTRKRTAGSALLQSPLKVPRMEQAVQ